MGRPGWLHRCLHKCVILRLQHSAHIDDFTDNGGPAGVLYELLVACIYYGFLAASIAEVRFICNSL